MTEESVPPENRTRIKILPPEEARRIAAGEVIDRPAALIREFLDNAIDSGAQNIEVFIEGGGCKKAEVADDGAGMDREDLEICVLAHATSKITSLDDLDTSRTLGFRGEALAAAAAVSHLEIITSMDGREAWRLETEPVRDGEFPRKTEQTRRTRGTTVRAENLFESIPARKKFLKREASEAMLCRQAFIDKALAFHTINFRFIQDGRLKVFLPASQSKKERFADALLEPHEKIFLNEINVTGNGFTAAIVIGGPELNRSDKRMLHVFANGRRIQDYALVQAMEYGVQGYFPNGTHPVGAVYVEIDPSLADFNIHPAKREVRFRDGGAIHHAISSALRDFFRHLSLRESAYSNTQTLDFAGETGAATVSSTSAKAGGSFTYTEPYSGLPQLRETDYPERASFVMEAITEKLSAFSSPNAADENRQYKFAGRLFGLFLLIECGDRLYIIDQHAAHERILYNDFLSQPVAKQELLAPIPFSTESEADDHFLETKQEQLKDLGVEIKKDSGLWRIEVLPSLWRMSDSETVREIIDLCRAGENMAERWAATLCCHQAVKDGDYLDDSAALELGLKALALSDPRCPHGRPIWTEISLEGLLKAVKRK